MYRNREGGKLVDLLPLGLSLPSPASCLRFFFERKTLVFLMICESRSPVWDQA